MYTICMNWTLLGALAVNLVCALAGSVSIKLMTVHPSKVVIAAWIFFVIVTQVSMLLVVRAGGLAEGAGVAVVLTFIGTVLLGVLFFQEALTISQWIGIILGIISALLILNLMRFA
jgi:drug/metabolite transporter (DMT)-like permease